MIQINPGEYLPLDYELGDPSDSDTRYVRSYVRKRKGSSDVLLATLDLVDQGSQRFTYTYPTPPDSDPYVLIITWKVFDDAAYTIESGRYARTQEKYLVSQRWMNSFGGRGGSDVDYESIRKMMKEEISKIPVQEKVNIRPLLDALQEVIRNVKGIVIPAMPKIEIPKQEKVDFSGVINAIESVQKEVRSIEIPKTDLNPVFSMMENILSDLTNIVGKVSGETKKVVSDSLKELKAEMNTIDFVRTKESKPFIDEKKRKLSI